MSTPSRNQYISKSEFYHELRDYVCIEEFDKLKQKYERLKRSVREGRPGNDLDEYAERIKNFGSNNIYDATKELMCHVYTEEEILGHTVSGKRSNSKIMNVKPKFTPERYNKLKSAIQQKFPEAAKDSTVLTKKITAVQKRLALEKVKRENNDHPVAPLPQL